MKEWEEQREEGRKGRREEGRKRKGREEGREEQTCEGGNKSKIIFLETILTHIPIHLSILEEWSRELELARELWISAWAPNGFSFLCDAQHFVHNFSTAPAILGHVSCLHVYLPEPAWWDTDQTHMPDTWKFKAEYIDIRKTLCSRKTHSFW